jgi:hypothetical protein
MNMRAFVTTQVNRKERKELKEKAETGISHETLSAFLAFFAVNSLFPTAM